MKNVAVFLIFMVALAAGVRYHVVQGNKAMEEYAQNQERSQ